jgi:putative redox protein
MQINIQRVNENVHFEATGSAGVKINIDGSPAVGGEDAGIRPMELLLMGIGSCAAIDIVSILKKQKQVIEDFSITVDGTREEGKEPSPFKTIHMVFKLKGTLDESKVKRAVELSVEKYCSVKAMLDKVAEITFGYELN